MKILVTGGAGFIGSHTGRDLIKRGARIIVLEKDNHLNSRREDIIFLKVADSRLALAKLAANFYDNPALKIKVIGITGTNGKTKRKGKRGPLNLRKVLKRVRP